MYPADSDGGRGTCTHRDPRKGGYPGTSLRRGITARRLSGGGGLSGARARGSERGHVVPGRLGWWPGITARRLSRGAPAEADCLAPQLFMYGPKKLQKCLILESHTFFQKFNTRQLLSGGGGLSGARARGAGAVPSQKAARPPQIGPPSSCCRAPGRSLTPACREGDPQASWLGALAPGLLRWDLLAPSGADGAAAAPMAPARTAARASSARHGGRREPARGGARRRSSNRNAHK